MHLASEVGRPFTPQKRCGDSRLVSAQKRAGSPPNPGRSGGLCPRQAEGGRQGWPRSRDPRALPAWSPSLRDGLRHSAPPGSLRTHALPDGSREQLPLASVSRLGPNLAQAGLGVWQGHCEGGSPDLHPSWRRSPEDVPQRSLCPVPRHDRPRMAPQWPVRLLQARPEAALLLEKPA